MNLCEFNDLMDTLTAGEVAMLVLYTHDIVDAHNLPWFDKVRDLFTEFDDVGRPSMDLQTAYWFEEHAIGVIEDFKTTMGAKDAE